MKEDETTTVVASTTTSSDKSFDSVVVHPLVLLSVVDHYKRVDEVRARFFFSRCDLFVFFLSLVFRCAVSLRGHRKAIGFVR
jgi:hypothetical protein